MLRKYLFPQEKETKGDLTADTEGIEVLNLRKSFEESSPCKCQMPIVLTYFSISKVTG